MHVSADGRSSGASVETEVFHVVEMRNGKLAEVAGYLDEGAARAAAGLA